MVELGLSRILQPRLGLSGRMAGAGRDPARPARPRSGPGICRRRAPGDIAIALAHWRALAVVLLVSFIAPAEAQVLSSRIWPARDYTRLTLESRDEIKFTLFGVKDPERLVLDLELAELSPALLELNAKVAADDPYVQGLRVAHNRPGVVRLVLDLKAEVKPQVFTLKPIAEYGHRLVLDLYPLVPLDPLAALIEESERPRALDKSKAPRVARLAIIVIDAGHGGEDPGATGRHGSREKNITLTIARRLTKKENEADLVGGVNLDVKDVYLKKTLLDLAQTATIDHSLRLGDLVLRRLGAVNNLHRPRVEQASFAVLKAPDVPSILVETAFISNPQEEKRLNDESYQNKLARALLDGIRDYVVKHPPRPSSPLALN